MVWNFIEVWWWAIVLLIAPGVLGVVSNPVEKVALTVFGVFGVVPFLAEDKLGPVIAWFEDRKANNLDELADGQDPAPPSALIVPLVLLVPLTALVVADWNFGRARLLPFFGFELSDSQVDAATLGLVAALGLIVAVGVWAWEAEAAWNESRPTWPKKLVFLGLILSVADLVFLAWWGVIQKSGDDPPTFLTGLFEVIFLLIVSGAIAVLLRQTRSIIQALVYVALAIAELVLELVQWIAAVVLGIINGVRFVLMRVVELVCGPSKAMWNWLRTTPSLAGTDWTPGEIVWPPSQRVEDEVSRWLGSDPESEAPATTTAPADDAEDEAEPPATETLDLTSNGRQSETATEEEPEMAGVL
jgi:hypothetical protein